MLDKSIPHKHVLMKRSAGTPAPSPVLPEGYRFVTFQPDDEKTWARLEASVLEFPDAVEAYEYYRKYWLPFLPELERRCTFIENPDGEKVATATAWWGYTGDRRDPWVDWVSVSPGSQGLGLGKAVFANIVQLMLRIEGDRDFYLHTQTWSHVAIRIYQKAGFHITREPNLRGCYANDEYDEASEILSSVGVSL